VSRPDLTVLVVSYETRELTLDCLRSLFETTRDAPPEVVVVDNGSRDGSADAIARHFPQVTLLRLEENVGFARANNLAAERAGTPYLLLLNPDTVVRAGAVRALLDFAGKHPEAGIVGGRTLFADGTLNPSSCWGRPTPWSLLCAGLGLSSVFRRSPLFDPESMGRWARDDAREVDIVSGCFLLIRRELWDELGGFDEAFFMYGEDADLCLRARRAGSRCRICPDAEIVHLGGASEAVRADKMVRLFRAKALLFRKHWGPAAARFGAAMLGAWALSRMLAFGLLRWTRRPGASASHATWRDVWRRRREWSRERLAGEGARILAVSSGGGHWVQLKQLLPAFEGHRLSFVTVDPACAAEVEAERFYVVNDANLWRKGALLFTAIRIAWILLRFRPDAVVSTGAAPGFFAILFGRWLGARTIWVDSIANAERLSLSGEKAGRFADLWLTQWPHLARPEGPHYAGSVL